MWQRFTEGARKVVFHAQEEAGRLGQTSVSAEHFLLGLAREEADAGAVVLGRLGVDLAKVRSDILAVAAKADESSGRDMQLTVHAKRVLDLAHDETRRFGTDYIGTEHLLLGLIRERDGAASHVLESLGVDLDSARREVEKIQSERQEPKVAVTNGHAGPEVRSHANGYGTVAIGSFTLKHVHTEDGLFESEVEAATRLASLLGQTTVSPSHLAVVVLSDPTPPVTRLFGRFGIDAQSLLSHFKEADATTPSSHPTEPAMSYEAGYVLTRAVEKAWGLFHEQRPGREHLLLALIEDPGHAGTVLRMAGVEPFAALQEMVHQHHQDEVK